MLSWRDFRIKTWWMCKPNIFNWRSECWTWRQKLLRDLEAILQIWRLRGLFYGALGGSAPLPTVTGNYFNTMKTTFEFNFDVYQLPSCMNTFKHKTLSREANNLKKSFSLIICKLVIRINK